MIFVTVGLEKFPFDRLLRAVDRLVESGTIQGDVFGQIGHSSYEPAHFEYSRFMSFGDMQKYLREADTVICHCGVGTILLALEMGKLPLVLPRRAAYGEQVDDHQLDLARHLESAGRILVADTEEVLPRMLIRHAELKGSCSVRSASSSELGALVSYLRMTLRVGHGS